MARKDWKANMLKFFHRLYKFFSSGYELLLLILLLLFFFRPIDRDYPYVGIWEVCVIGVFLTSVFIFPHKKLTRQAVLITGVAALICGWIGLYFQSLEILIPCLVLTILFMCICTGAVVYREIIVAKATWKSLTPVICAYFFIAYAFGYAYVIIAYLYPEADKALLISHPSNEYFAHGEYLSQGIIMSLSSLLAINALDPEAPSQMHTMQIVQGLLSQFYLAALTSRIIGVYRNYRKEKEAKEKQKNA